METHQLREVFVALSQPVPTEFIHQRKQGGNDLDYIPWHHVNRLLDERAPGWSGEAVVSVAGDTVIVSYSISVPTAEGIVTRGAVGSEKLGSGFDPVASAEQQAFKRAAARFGIGLDLYDKAAAAPATAASKPPSTRPPGWEPKWERARA